MMERSFTMRVINKQGNSRMCLICGLDNPYGVHARFYELEDQRVCGLFTFQKEHQSYPGRVHGGMISAMLDELACRAFWLAHPKKLGVTIDLTTKYRKPVPYDVPLKGTGKIVKCTPRFFIAECQILNDQNEILAEGEIKYLIVPDQQITDASYEEEMAYQLEDDVWEIAV